MTSIPADRTLSLGNVIYRYKVRQLMEIAELQKPVDLANDRLNNLTLSSYKIEMVLQQMVSMKAPEDTLKKLADEMTELKSNAAEAAVDLAEVIIQSEKDIREKKEEHGQTKIAMNIESPISWEDSTIKTDLAISNDTMRFDVQYFSALETKERSFAGSKQTSTATAHSSAGGYLRTFFGTGRGSGGVQHADNVTRNVQAQSRETEIHGILVLVAECTHRNADILAPCILDARKTIFAWNRMFPDEKIKTDPKSLYEAAMNEDESRKSLKILTGVTKSSSFVGYVSLLKEEKERSRQEVASIASSFAHNAQIESFERKMNGSYSRSSQRNSSRASAFSQSQISNSATLSVIGMIPKITAQEHMQAITGLNPDPSAIMGQMSAVANSSSSSMASGADAIAAAANDSGTKATFIQLNNEHLQNSVSALVERANVNNKIIDINTMMTAFENYTDMASTGGCGVPTNFFIKDIEKHEVAKVYIRKFFPNGAFDAKSAREGQLGQESTGGGSN